MNERRVAAICRTLAVDDRILKRWPEKGMSAAQATVFALLAETIEEADARLVVELRQLLSAEGDRRRGVGSPAGEIAGDPTRG